MEGEGVGEVDMWIYRKIGIIGTNGGLNAKF